MSNLPPPLCEREKEGMVAAPQTLPNSLLQDLLCLLDVKPKLAYLSHHWKSLGNLLPEMPSFKNLT